jgi:mannose-6-phosphate isomerase-like protein (cupin superfamily)
MKVTAPIDLAAELAKVDGVWSPRIVGRVNDQFVKVARLHGTFTWHAHDHEDELFLVLRGSLEIRFEDRPNVVFGPGQFVVVPRGVRHLPVASEPVDVMLVEPVSTQHTGAETVEGLTRSIEHQMGGAADRLNA